MPNLKISKILGVLFVAFAFVIFSGFLNVANAQVESFDSIYDGGSNIESFGSIYDGNSNIESFGSIYDGGSNIESFDSIYYGDNQVQSQASTIYIQPDPVYNTTVIGTSGGSYDSGYYPSYGYYGGGGSIVYSSGYSYPSTYTYSSPSRIVYSSSPSSYSYSQIAQAQTFNGYCSANTSGA
ncbi:hypothetical protein IT397_00505 [Candidatus Nomurabacteria bacterium]|nr:hypothetical protein [Candidatus Nomurabacteria bacterium]